MLGAILTVVIGQPVPCRFGGVNSCLVILCSADPLDAPLKRDARHAFLRYGGDPRIIKPDAAAENG